MLKRKEKWKEQVMATFAVKLQRNCREKFVMLKKNKLLFMVLM